MKTIMNTTPTPTPFLQRTLVVWIGAMICCALWGSAFPCIKIGYEMFGIAASDTAAQILFAGYRFTLAGILTVMIGSVLSRSLLYPADRGAAGTVLWLCLLQTVLQYFFFYIGLAHTSGVKASIIEAVNVFVAILVASLIFRQERLTLQKMVGCVIGFAGVVLVNLNGMNFQMSLTGEGFIFLSTVAYAFSSVFMKRMSVKYHPVMLSGWQFIVGGILMILGGLAMGGRVFTAGVTIGAGAAGMLFYLAVISAVAYSLWGILLKHNPVSKVAVFGFMNPVCGVILSAILLKEGAQTAWGLAAVSLVLVCVGIYIVNREEKR